MSSGMVWIAIGFIGLIIKFCEGRDWNKPKPKPRFPIEIRYRNTPICSEDPGCEEAPKKKKEYTVKNTVDDLVLFDMVDDTGD